MERAARATRNVSARELSRRLSNLLDEVESDGTALVVIRYGRPAAILVPFQEVAERPKLPRIADLGKGPSPSSDVEVEEIDESELDDAQRRVVLDVSRCTSLHWTPGQADLPVRELLPALSRLETCGILERGPGAARRLTSKGERLARRLDSKT